MASSIHRIVSHTRRAHQTSVLQQLSRHYSTSESLVEYKAGEIGTVSGIPDEHLVRKVSSFCPFLSNFASDCFFRVLCLVGMLWILLYCQGVD